MLCISERENNVDFTDLALTINSPSTVKSVSYTHLDVYKRQESTMLYSSDTNKAMTIGNANLKSTFDTLPSSKALFPSFRLSLISIASVSYTHLQLLMYLIYVLEYLRHF